MVLPAFNRFVGGFEPRRRRQLRYHKIDLGMGGDGDRACGAKHYFDFSVSLFTQSCAQRRGVGFVRNRHYLWPVAKSLLAYRLDVRACRQRNNLKPVRITIDDAESAAAYGAGGTQDGNALHVE